MVNGTVVHKASGHLLLGLVQYGESNNTPLPLPTNILEVQSEHVVQLVLLFYVFRICAAQIFHVSKSDLRRL